MSEEIKELKKLAVDYSILYIEDNDGLRANVAQLLKKIFDEVYTAENGKIGYSIFKKHQPDIIITDINMPEMSGFEMAQKINTISNSSKIIIMSAHEEKEYLHRAIDLGIYRFLNKPAKTDVLLKAIYDAILMIQKEQDKILFQMQLQDIFNYQNNIIMMIKAAKLILVNHRFLDFYDVETIEDFLKKGHTLDSLLFAHAKTFLCSTKEKSWHEEACENPGKLYHTKMKNHNDEIRHLILKAKKIPNKNEQYVLSFDDVTELNLLKLYDKDSAASDAAREDNSAVLKMLKIVMDNSAQIKVHNFYKGLTITNTAVIVKADDESTIMKSSHTQLRIVQITKNTVISSEIFPTPVLIKKIDKVDFDKQTIVFSKMQFLAHSATERKNMRLEPEDNHKVSVFFDGRKFTAECKIIDISITSVKVEVSALRPSIEEGIELNLSMVLPTGANPLIINVSGTLYRVDERGRSYDLVVLFELHGKNLENLTSYMAKRQMALIREFKSLEVKE